MKKKILITGAKQGIGRDSAVALAKRGHIVFATTETKKGAIQLVSYFERHNLAISVAQIDITNKAHYQKAVEFEPDIIINNAAIGESGPLGEIPMKYLENNFQVNVFGTIALTQTIIPNMITKKSGRILIISSLAGKLVLPYLGAYSMTKFALEAAGEAWRQELLHHGIYVAIVEPGAIATGFNERMNASKYKWLNETSLFIKDLPKMKIYEDGLVNKQYPTKKVVSSIIHAVESKRPRARYIAPSYPYSPLVLLAKLIPDKLRDRFIKR
jgi:short-subunit dehydrogenase